MLVLMTRAPNDIWEILHRRRRLVLIFMIVGAAAGAICFHLLFPSFPSRFSRPGSLGLVLGGITGLILGLVVSPLFYPEK